MFSFTRPGSDPGWFIGIDDSAFYSTFTDFSTAYRTGSVLDNSQDTDFCAINDHWPAFAFAHDLGEVTSKTKPIVISVGHARDPVLEYIIDNDVIQHRSPYFLTHYTSIMHVIRAFPSEHPDAPEKATACDAQVKQDTGAISSGYVGLVGLNGNGHNVDGILMFMKAEVPSNGNINTVDVIFPAWPISLYTNPAIGKYLLLPHYQYQAAGLYSNEWALHDMGAHYSSAIGHNDGLDERVPVEESGNNLIATLSYTRKTEDTSLIKQYSGLLDWWTRLAVLFVANTSQGPLENQTNLAIGVVIRIQATAESFRILGDEQKVNNYSLGLTYNPLGEKLTGITISS
ncbi:hypothetical protein BDM02DRAFT_3184786 [Thelephora ganbajun]|uniref:Uncharacterized protein n=1 Tax=Thelephora ganbajun TaxID=370292 RepID=A0ACB6ZNS3_THEGA|nr:hypothetical protein BDM02DRAFT_3184786 [Thelephora ganbajun]